MLNRQANRPFAWLVFIFCAVALISAAACQPLAALPSSTSTSAPTHTASSTLLPSNTPEPPTPTLPAASPTPVPPTKTLTATPTDVVCTETEGELLPRSFESSLLAETFHFQIFFPPCYTAQPDEPYPVLYLLHGMYADETQWENLGAPEALEALIQSEQAKPMLLVMPRDGENKSYPIATFPEVIIQELIPYIEAHYPTLAAREGRMIGGISRGASWALRLGVLHHDLFSKIGLHSLPLEPAESDDWAAILAAMAPEDRPEIFMDSGHRDRDIDSTRSFEWAITLAGIPHTWYLFNGYHNEAYWGQHISIYMDWYCAGD